MNNLRKSETPEEVETRFQNWAESHSELAAGLIREVWMAGYRAAKPPPAAPRPPLMKGLASLIAQCTDQSKAIGPTA